MTLEGDVVVPGEFLVYTQRWTPRTTCRLDVRILAADMTNTHMSKTKRSNRSPTQRLDDALLKKFMRSFFGYGNPRAPVWFVGMEEGGGTCFAEVRKRLSCWRRRKSRMLEDVASFHLDFEGPGCKWFRERPPTQSTWRQLIRSILIGQGLDSDIEAVRQYQKREFARRHGKEACLELLPLPSQSLNAKTWKYHNWTEIPRLASPGLYRAYYIKKRIPSIRALIMKWRPRAVVFYGATYQRHWEKISDANFGLNDFPRVDIKNGTLYILLPHATSRPSATHYFETCGELLRDAGVYEN